MKKLLLLLAPLVLFFAACEASSENKIDDTVQVESLAITPGQIELEVGQTQQLEAVLRPDGVEAKVTWLALVSATSEEGVVSVDANGLVTALKPGNAEVEARCGQAADICYITVIKPIVPVESIELDSYRLEVTEGEQVAIVATVMPEEARVDNPVYYTSKNTAIATVDESGVVTGVAAGETKIDVQAGGVGVVCNVTVNAAKKITLSDAATSDVAFSTVTLSGKLNVSGFTFQYADAMFYYMETDGNPTAADIKQNGSQSTSTRITIPDNEALSETFTAKVSNLAVKTRYCYVSAVKLSVTGEFVFGEVQSFTTADVPAMQEVVDMGLRVKWRGWNVGASKPEEAGNYYSWGETSFKEIYTWETYKFGEENNTLTRYVTNAPYGYNGFIDYRGTLSIDDDAATVNIGLPWRMPVYGEYVELLNHSDKKWTRYNGVYGIMMTSTINGSMLFFPAGGYRSESGSSPSGFGTIGQYWTSELNYVENTKASVLILQKQVSDINMGSFADRYFGLSVRAVYN